ncbi:carbamoyltransferase HypF, partial [Rubrivivax gelatinosus]|uniref:carbamoyltransferase HypF n=1 Tax=Rubrivivax gelatinosus TaxID=28068 RepID=UPI001389BC9A
MLRFIDGEPRLLRRARGYAPEPIALPAGFEAAPAVLAHGSELKNTFCLLRDGQLADAATLADTRRSLHELQRFYAFAPRLQACDAHPDYLSTQAAHATAGVVVPVLHHHAHVAACLADNGWPLDGGAVIGVALDGLGLGADGELWGGEFALADYTRFERRGSFQAVALPGGEQAVHEPWRNTYAQLVAAFGWDGFEARWAGLELHAFLATRPRAVLDTMIARQLNSPPASSCGRLFDAVAAALGLARERTAYEGQAAVLLEAVVDRDWLAQAGPADGLPFEMVAAGADGVARLDPRPMWAEL